MKPTIEVKETPAINLAYLSHIGYANQEQTFNKLVSWASTKGLLDTADFKMLTIFHNSPKVTPLDELRLSICVVLSKPVEAEGEIGLTTIEEGKFVIGHYELLDAEFAPAWRELFAWMNERGHKKADRPTFELFHNDFRQHPEKKFIVDFYIPVE